VGHEALQDAQVAGLATLGDVLHVPVQGRREGRAAAGEVLADGARGVGPGVEATEELQDPAVAEAQGRVGLLGRERLHGQGRRVWAVRIPENHARRPVAVGVVAPDIESRQGMPGRARRARWNQGC
jgi:hypothetical protein